MVGVSEYQVHHDRIFFLHYALCSNNKATEGEHKCCGYYGSAGALTPGGVMDANMTL